MFDRMMKSQQLADAGFYRTALPWRIKICFDLPKIPLDLHCSQIMKPNAVQIPCHMK